jgi:hypothetical protein
MHLLTMADASWINESISAPALLSSLVFMAGQYSVNALWRASTFASHPILAVQAGPHPSIKITPLLTLADAN